MKLVIPYPPKELNPNNRRGWGQHYRVAKKYKNDCYLLAKTIKPDFGDKDIYLSITFHPGKARRRDVDNCLASLKAALDGISAAWGVDDSRFKLHPVIGPTIKGGSVVVEIIGGSV